MPSYVRSQPYDGLRAVRGILTAVVISVGGTAIVVIGLIQML